MIISIIGSGALGKAYGGLLSLTHNEIHYLMRSEYKEIKTNGFFNLQFLDHSKTLKINSPLIHNHPNELPPSDVVIISLKTTENKHITELLTSCLKENTIVLIIQNGIGNEEWISQVTGKRPIICGISTMGAQRPDALTVEIPFRGDLKLAPYFLSDMAACKAVAELFMPALAPQRALIFDNYKEIRWHKLIWNIPFAALSIIYNQDTQTLASRQPFASIVTSIISEVVDIAASDGVTISNEFIEKMLEGTKKVKNYYPSMYRDFVAGKATEKEYIIDNVLKIARKNDIKTPMLNLIESNLE